MLQWKGKRKGKQKGKSCEVSLFSVYIPKFSFDEELGTFVKVMGQISSEYLLKPNLAPNIQKTFEKYNLIFEGDNLAILENLAEIIPGTVDLVYIDPPFMKNISFYRQVALRGIDEEVVYKQKQYADTWELDKYLQFLYERLSFIKILLKENGSIYIHLDEDAAHYIKIVLDEVFGIENFRRQIIWNTASLNVAGFKGRVRNNYIYATGIILYYTKSSSYTFNPQFTPHSQEFIDKKYKLADSKGKYRITRRKNKIYLNEDSGEPITNIWNDILSFNYAKAASRESVFYPTQKPEGLLERIIKTSSNPGDIVLDCFSGSGTTATVAQKLNRKWIICDKNPNAVHISSKRLQRLISPDFPSDNIRSFQIWRESGRELLKNPIKLEVECDGDYVTIEIVEVNEMQIYANAKVKQKKIDPPPLALLDSVFISFSADSANSKPFVVEFSDIPRGRKESITGKYTFFLRDRINNYEVAKVRIVDIFGNCYNSRLELIDISDSDLD